MIAAPPGLPPRLEHQNDVAREFVPASREQAGRTHPVRHVRVCPHACIRPGSCET